MERISPDIDGGKPETEGSILRHTSLRNALFEHWGYCNLLHHTKESLDGLFMFQEFRELDPKLSRLKGGGPHLVSHISSVFRLAITSPSFQPRSTARNSIARHKVTRASSVLIW